MVTLPEFRQQYPEYNDLSDEDLTRRLHSKFYSDKPFDDFARRFGYTPPSPAAKPEVEDNTTTLGHIGEFFSGIPRGVANTGISAAQGVVALANLIAGDKPTESEWIKAMEEAQKHVTSKGWFAQKPGYEKSIPGQLGEGVGSIAAFALPGAGQAALTGRVTGGVAKAILPLAAVTGAGEAVDRLSQFKGETSYGQQFWATMLGLPIGATDALPVQRMLGNLAKALGMAEKGAGQPIIDYVKRAIAQAGLEGGQEAVQSILQDLSEKYVYNPDKAVGETALSEFGIGAGSGAIAQIGGDILTTPFRRRAMARHREGVEEEIKKVRDQMEAENKLRTEFIEKATNPQLLLEDKSSPVKALPIPDIVYAPGTKEIVPEPGEDVLKYSERLGTKVFETLPNGRFRVIPSPKGHLIVGPGNYVIGNPVATIESAHKIAGDLNQRSLKRDVEEDARRALRRAAIGETGALLQTAKDTINPIAPFSRSDVGETSADLVNNERRKVGLPPLSEFGVKDLAEFLPLQDVQRLLKIRAPLTQEKVTPETIHALAKEKNIAWDNDVNFMEFSARVTGSRHLDRMNGTQLLMLRDALRSMPTFDKKSSIPVMPHQRFTEEQYDTALGRAKREGKLDHDTVQKATGLTKPEDVWALLEKMVDRGDARPMTSRVMRSERGDAFIRGDGSLIFLNKDGKPITSDSLRHRDKTVRRGEYELFGQNLTTETLPEGRSEFRIKEIDAPPDLEGTREAGAMVRGTDTKAGRVFTSQTIGARSKPGPRKRYAVTEARYGKQTIGVKDDYNHAPHDFLGEANVATFDTRAEAEAYVAAQKEQPIFDRAGQPGIPITGAPHTGTAVKNWLEKIGLTPSKKAVEKSDLIEKSLRAKLDAVGLQDIRIKLANLAGAMKNKGDVPEGVYRHWQKTIYLALDAIPPGAKTDAQIAKALGQVMDHEMIHAMRALDLFTDQEWKTLTRYVANKPSHTAPSKTYLQEAQEAYAKQFEDMTAEARADAIIEEAVADAFRGWVENVRNAAGQPAGLFNRIVQFLKRLRDAMQGRGFKSADEVFGEIDTGAIGRRQRGVVRAVDTLPAEVAERVLRERARKAGVDVGPDNATVDEKFAVAARNVNLDKPSFLLWFDQSKVVNSDGSPKPLYHGTDADFSNLQKNNGAWTMDTAMGLHLAVDPVIANRFAANASKMSGAKPDRAGANVKPFYLASKNPYVMPTLQFEGMPGPEFDADIFDSHAIGETIKDPAFFKEFYGSRALRNEKNWEAIYNELKEGRMPDDVVRPEIFTDYLEATGDAFKAYARSVGIPDNMTWAIKQTVPRFKKWLEANGYDSIQYTITAPAEIHEAGYYRGDGDPANFGMEVDPTAYIVWKPEVLKSIFNEMSPKTLFGAGQDKFSVVKRPVAPVWSSKLHRVLNAETQAKATGNQWLGRLKSQGVKDEEIEWSGLKELLGEAGDKPVGLADILFTVDENKSTEIREELLADWSGGENEENLEGLHDVSYGYPEARTPGGRKYREMLLLLPNIGGFESPHFNEQRDLLAHMRFDSRHIEGDNTLFIDETQSDWHQAGAKEGYYTRDMKKRKDEASARLDAVELAIEEEVNRFLPGARRHIALAEKLAGLDENNAVLLRSGATPFDIGNLLYIGYVIPERKVSSRERKIERLEDIGMTKADQDHLANLVLELNDATRAYDAIKTRGIPDAPFKKTWTQLLLKRAIRYAAETDHDAIAWTTGEMQSRRYKKLFENVNKIIYFPDDNTLDVHTVLGERRSIDLKDKDDIARVIGAPMAKALLETPPTMGRFGEEHVLETPANTNIGHSFYNFLYDNKLKNEANGIGKKHGATVQQARLDEGQAVHKLKITDALKSAALYDGFDKFSVKRANLDEATRDRFAVNKKRNYTPAIDAVVEKVGNMRSDETFGEKMIRITDAKPWTWFRQKFLNKYEAIGRNQRRLKEQGLVTDAELLADAGAFQAAIMSDRAMGVMGASLRYGIPVWKDGRATVQKTGIDGRPVDGLIKIFEPVGNKNLWAEFKTYAVSVRAARLINEKNKDGTPREKFMTPAEISEGLKLGTIYPEFKNVFEEYQRWNSGLVKFMVDTGVIDAKMGDVWMETSDYIPFYREFDGDGSLQGRHKMARSMFNSLTDQKPAKQLKGDDAAINDIAENIMQNARAAITAGMKNMAAQRVIRDMMKLGEGVALADRADAHHGRVVTVREKGVDKHYQVDDKLLYNALTGMDARDLGIMKIFTEPARILRELVTKDPGFMAANLMRDTLSAWVTSGRAFTPVYSTWRGVMKEIGGSVSAKALEYSGVYGGFDFVGDIQTTGRKLQNQYNKSYGRAAWDKLERLTSASDAATRIAVYERVLKETGNPAQAEFEALEVMNFSRKGSSRAIRILAAIVPFFNARIQGLDVLMRAAGGQAVGYTGRPDTAAVVKRFWTRALFMIASSLAYYAVVSDDDDWKNATADERDNNWIIPLKGIFGPDTPALKVPIPFEVGVLFKVIPERFSALVDGKDTYKDTLSSARRQAASNIPVSPEAMVPQFIKPLLESMVNYSFYRGREVESAYLRDLVPSERVSQGTSEIAKQMGAGVDMSPVRIDNIIKGYTGSLGTIAISLIDEGLRWAVNAPAKPDRRIEEYPIMRRFLQQSVPTGQLEQFYDIRNRAREVARTVSYLNNVGRADEAMKMIQREPELFTYSSALERMAKQISDLRRYRSVIENDKYMDGTTKRSMIDGIRQMELQMAEFGRTLKREIFK